MPVFQYNVFGGWGLCLLVFVVCFTKTDDMFNLLTPVLVYMLDDTAYV